MESIKAERAVELLTLFVARTRKVHEREEFTVCGADFGYEELGRAVKWLMGEHQERFQQDVIDGHRKTHRGLERIFEALKGLDAVGPDSSIWQKEE